MAASQTTQTSPPSSSGSDTSSAAQCNHKHHREWQDVEDDSEDVLLRSFFSNQTFHSVQEFLEDSKQAHNFDFANVFTTLGMWRAQWSVPLFD
jgi:hypothetical protein